MDAHDQLSRSQPRDSQLTDAQRFEKKRKRLDELSAEAHMLLGIEREQCDVHDAAEMAAMEVGMAAYKAAGGAAAAPAAEELPCMHVPVHAGPCDDAAPTVVGVFM